MGFLKEIYSSIVDRCQPLSPIGQIENPEFLYRPHGTIFRGEPKDYPHVSSTLYRYIAHRFSEWVVEQAGDREKIEKAIFKYEHHIASQAEIFLGQDNYFSPPPISGGDWWSLPEEYQKRLAEIRHNGGKANYIDFTMDVNIALFFACYSPTERGCDGRVILYHWLTMKGPPIDKKTVPSVVHSDNQRSILVRPMGGVLSENSYDIVPVPKDRKEEILSDLWKYHGIRPEIVYRSLNGFLNNMDLILPGDSTD